MEIKKYTLLGKDGRYYNKSYWIREQDMQPKYLYDTIKEAKEILSWAKCYADDYSCMQKNAQRILDNEPVIEEVVIKMKFVNHDMTQVPINDGWI